MLSSPLTSAKLAPVAWTVSAAPVPYLEAVQLMEERVEAIRRGSAAEQVWLLEHLPLYTAGTSGRGGQYTYHGPGQRVGYVMLDLKNRKPDARAFVRDLEEWLIRTLARFDVKGERRSGRVGIWVALPDGREDKIAAIGVRLRNWVTFHGISINVAPDLSHYSGIVPCGVDGEKFGVTSLAALGIRASLADMDAALKPAFEEIFGPVAAQPSD